MPRGALALRVVLHFAMGLRPGEGFEDFFFEDKQHVYRRGLLPHSSEAVQHMVPGYLITRRVFGLEEPGWFPSPPNFLLPQDAKPASFAGLLKESWQVATGLWRALSKSTPSMYPSSWTIYVSCSSFTSSPLLYTFVLTYLSVFYNKLPEVSVHPFFILSLPSFFALPTHGGLHNRRSGASHWPPFALRLTLNPCSKD